MANPNILNVTSIYGNTAYVTPGSTAVNTSWTFNGTTALSGLTPAVNSVNKVNSIVVTNMAPHNLGEVIAAAKFLMENPKATLKQLMKIVPAPDFPTGGYLVATEGLADAYANGRGSFKVRATAVIEKVTARKQGIVITELPYNIGPEKIVEKIADLVKAKKVQGISDIVDLSDGQSGTKVVVEIKNGYEAADVLENLYRLTPMEDAFSINAVALVNGKP